MRKGMWLAGITMLVVSGEIVGQGSLDRFRYQPGKVTSGVVYHYHKSNIDGSHGSNVSLYVADSARIEALKWSSRSTQATLVTADMDWKLFSVRRIQSWRLAANGERTAVAEARYVDELQGLAVSAGLEDTVRIDYFPWHSYDFDFASLNLTLRHLIDPTGKFSVGIADPVFEDGRPRFLYKGTVDIEYAGEEDHEGRRSRKYRIDGPGLENRGGVLWVDKKGEYLIEFRIALPDEPGYESGRLRLDRVETMAPAEWKSFVSRPSAGR